MYYVCNMKEIPHGLLRYAPETKCGQISSLQNENQLNLHDLAEIAFLYDNHLKHLSLFLSRQSVQGCYREECA